MLQAAVRRSGAEAGFSLIEVLMALVVAGLAMGAIAGVFADALAGKEVSDRLTTALTIAEEKMASVGTEEPVRAGGKSGQFEAFDWRIVVAPYEDTTEKPDSGLASWRPDLRLYRIETTVSWRAWLRQQQVTLSTLLLAREAQ